MSGSRVTVAERATTDQKEAATVLSTVLVAVAIVLVFSVSTLLWGPEPSIRRVLASTFIALGVTALTWVIVGSVVGQPSETGNEGLGLLLMMTGTSVVLQGKRTVVA